MLRRLGTAVAALALGGGGLASVALAVTASPAEAASVAAVTTNVVSGTPLIGGWTQQGVSIAVDAPPTVTQGSEFALTASPQPTVVPTTEPSGVTVDYVSGVTTILPVPAGATVVSVPTGLTGSYSGGTNGSLPASGTFTVTVTLCTGTGGTTCTASSNDTTAASNSNPAPSCGSGLGTASTYPFAGPTLTTDYLEIQTPCSTDIPSGATVSMPSVTAMMKATGAVGTTLTTQLAEFDSTANLGSALGNVTIHAWPSGQTTIAGLSQSSPISAVPYSPVTLATTQIVAGPAVFSVAPSTGGLSGGTSVTITGSGFTGATAVDFGSTPATSFTVDSDTQITAVSPPGAGVADITVTTAKGTSASWSGDRFAWVGTAKGYHLVAGDGGIFSFGGSLFHGSMGGKPLNKPVVGMAAVPSGGGYWEVASDGGIFSFGSAQFYGSMGGKPLNAPIVGMAAVPGGGGYWEVAADGGIFSFGSAQFYGSMGGKPLNKPIVGMAAVPGGGGYWEVASDGGIFSFGSAQFYGSMGGKPLNKPIVGMATTPDGGGYWEVASDGGIFSFGDANFYGSMGGKPLNAPVVAMAATPDGGGYWEVASDGGIFSFGDANFYGSMGGKPLNAPVVGMGLTLSA
ncbi:MAG: IPT/TIG domain-containing protein [Actinomycetota bacterium]|nr:IPT/TIG domain-containing protein [Actinomycetota bacterium]